jgi:hypothetical protein
MSIEIADAMRQIQPLSDEARIEAKRRAVQIVQKENGDAPSRDQFQNVTVSKYPAWVNRLIMALCAFVLIAAFVPSAIRLYAIGSQTFEQAIQDEASAIAAGLAIVIMSETAQILFSLAAAVLNTNSSVTSRRLLFASMAAATILALVGNAQISLPGHWTNPFAYLEALLPPLLVLSTAYVLKEQMLMAIETRHANERAYQEALVVWQQSNASPERHPRYMGALANAMRDAIKETNGRGAGSTNRKELMANLETAHWRALVQRELATEHWYEPEPVAPLHIVQQTGHALTSNGGVPQNGYGQATYATPEENASFLSGASRNGTR